MYMTENYLERGNFFIFYTFLGFFQAQRRKERVEKIISINKIIICKEFNKHENIDMI